MALPSANSAVLRLVCLVTRCLASHPSFSKVSSHTRQGSLGFSLLGHSPFPGIKWHCFECCAEESAPMKTWLQNWQLKRMLSSSPPPSSVPHPVWNVRHNFHRLLQCRIFFLYIDPLL